MENRSSAVFSSKIRREAMKKKGFLTPKDALKLKKALLRGFRMHNKYFFLNFRLILNINVSRTKK